MYRSRKIIFGVFASLIVSLYFSPQTNAETIQWPLKTNQLEVVGLAANADNNISLMGCGQNNNYDPYLFEHFGDHYEAATTNNEPSQVQCLDPADTYSQTSADGTFYTYYIATVNGQPEDRIAAMKGDKVLWSTDITSEDLCSNNSDRSIPNSISIGPDGNIYTIITSNIISDCATYIAGFNGKTGAQIFKNYLGNRVPPNSSTTSWSRKGRLWTYDDKILLMDANGMEREFSYSGVENINARYQFPNVPNTGTYGNKMLHLVLANQNGRVFVVYETPWGCYPNVNGTYIRYHDTDGTSGTSSLNLGCNTVDYFYKPAADGNLAAYGYSGNVLIAHMDDNNHSINTFPIPQGYTQAKVMSFWQDTSGKGLLVRKLTDISGAHAFTVDEINSNNSLTNVTTINTGTSGYEFTIMPMGDVSGGSLYLPICLSSCSTPANKANNSWIHRIQLPNFGAVIRDASSLAKTLNIDTDSDSLTLSQEVLQGTSDHSMDTDGDGLSDYTESNLFTGRNAVFCGDANTTCNNYPNPIQKDLYVEIDWMKDGNNQSFQPTNTQLSLLKNAYAAHGITAHFDTGQYGGGNELPVYTQNLHFGSDPSGIGFYDYKYGTPTLSANFSSSRYHIWRYLVSGYEWNDGDPNTHSDEGSSGVSYSSDDDAFISFGLIDENPDNDFTYSNINYAIAGTILHELGHNLCLYSETSAQHPECYSQYIDSYTAPTTYNSVMNYSYQMSDLLDYSSGVNGSSDHNDWSAIGIGFADYNTSGRGDAPAAGQGKLRIGVTRSQAKQLRKMHRIFSRVDEHKRSPKRQLFDQLHSKNVTGASLRH